MKVVFCLLALAVSAFADSPADKLYHDLAKDYEHHVDPGNFSVEIGLTFLCGTLNRKTHVLTSRVFERYHWHDPRLAWDPSKYQGIRKGSIPAEAIWTPDIQLLNAFPHSEDRDEINAVVLANGSVYWIPPATYTTLCHHEEKDDDDTWHCRLKLGSWTYNDKEMPVELFAGGFDTKMYIPTCPYVVSHFTAFIKSTKYDCCPEEYLTLEVDFEIKERHDDDEEEHHEPERKKVSRSHHIPKRQCFWPHC